MFVTSELVRSLDDAVRADIENLRDGYFFWLQLSTVIVGIGCAAELPEVAHEIWPKLIRKSQEKVVQIIATLGLILVIVGIGGEWAFEAAVSTVDGILQRFDESLIAETQRQAAETYERAAVAMREAENAKQDAEEAKLRAQGANDKTDKETKDRKQLEDEVGSRKLSPAQQEGIGKACNSLYIYGPSKQIFIRSYGMDEEGADLAHQISKAMIAGGLYHHINVGDLVQTGDFDIGVLIFGPPEDEAFTTCLGRALSDIGKLKEVKVNGEFHRGTSMSGGVTTHGGVTLHGSSTIQPAGPRAPGSLVEIFVGKNPHAGDTKNK